MNELRHTVCLMVFLIAHALPAWGGVTLTGFVTDSVGETVPGATVKVYAAPASKSMLVYGAASPGGEFRLTLPGDYSNVTVKVSAVGYRTETMQASVGTRLHVRLSPAPTTLKAITVKAPAIRTQGDTLIFDVAAFSSRGDRSIEAVISRLPGITVDEERKIKYNGEPINKFYIEGADMLTGNYRLATRNISPEDVASVNVYENHQPKKVLEGIEFSERAALNLKLKKKSMLRPVGNLKAGAGYGGRRALGLGEGFGFLVSPELQLMGTLKAGNYGDTYSTEVSRSHQNMAPAALAGRFFNRHLFGSPPVATGRYLHNNSLMTSANALVKKSKVTTLTFNVSYLQDRNRYGSRNVTEYFGLENGPLRITEENASVMRSNNLYATAKIETNANNLYLREQIGFSGEFTDNSYRLSGNSQVLQKLGTDSYGLRNRLDLTLRKGSRVWDIKSDISFSNLPVNSIHAFNTLADTLMADQSIGGFSFRSTHSTSFTKILSEKWMTGADMLLKADYDRIEATDRSRPSVAERTDVTSGYTLETRLVPYIQWKGGYGSVRIDAPLTLYDMGFRYGLARKHFYFHRLYPGASVTMRYTTRFKLQNSLLLSHNTTPGDIMDFMTVPVHTSYRTLSVGGSGVLGLRKMASVAYSASYRNPLYGFNGNLQVMFSRTSSNVMRSSEVSSSQTSGSVIDRKNSAENLNAALNLSKFVRGIGTTFLLSANYIDMRTRSVRNGSEIRLNNSVCILHPSLSSILVKDVLTVDLGCEYELSRQAIRGIGEPTHLSNITGKYQISLFPIKNLQISLGGSLADISIGDDMRKIDLFLDGSMRWMAGKWEIELKMRNLTDRKSYVISKYVGDDSYVTTYMLRPREGMLAVRWKF